MCSPVSVEARTNVIYTNELGVQEVRLFDPDSDDPFEVHITFSLYEVQDDGTSEWVADIGDLEIASLFMFKLANWYGTFYNDELLVDPFERRCTDG